MCIRDRIKKLPDESVKSAIHGAHQLEMFKTKPKTAFGALKEEELAKKGRTVLENILSPESHEAFEKVNKFEKAEALRKATEIAESPAEKASRLMSGMSTEARSKEILADAVEKGTKKGIFEGTKETGKQAAKMGGRYAGAKLAGRVLGHALGPVWNIAESAYYGYQTGKSYGDRVGEQARSSEIESVNNQMMSKKRKEAKALLESGKISREEYSAYLRHLNAIQTRRQLSPRDNVNYLSSWLNPFGRFTGNVSEDETPLTELEKQQLADANNYIKATRWHEDHFLEGPKGVTGSEQFLASLSLAKVQGAIDNVKQIRHIEQLEKRRKFQEEAFQAQSVELGLQGTNTQNAVPSTVNIQQNNYVTQEGESPSKEFDKE